MASFFYYLFKLSVLQWKHTLDSTSGPRGIFGKTLGALFWATILSFSLYFSEKLDKNLMLVIIYIRLNKVVKNSQESEHDSPSRLSAE